MASSIRSCCRATGWLPWQTMAFLADAHQRGILPQTGGGVPVPPCPTPGPTRPPTTDLTRAETSAQGGPGSRTTTLPRRTVPETWLGNPPVSVADRRSCCARELRLVEQDVAGESGPGCREVERSTVEFA
jgi:hypothetical protein